MLHTVKNLATVLLYEALMYKYIADWEQIRICSVQWSASYSRVFKTDMSLHNASFSNLEENRPFKKTLFHGIILWSASPLSV